MTPLKETVEGRNHQAGADAKNADHPAADAGNLRADAVSLEVPVKVHGSCLTEVVRGTTPLTRLFEEQAVTMIVFPQGGVLRMATPVGPGQMAVLTNLKSGQDAICRVIKVRAYATGKSYVEIEFTNRQPGYWGVYFPSDSSELAKKAVFPATSTPSSPAARADVNVPLETSAVPLQSASLAGPAQARAADKVDSRDSAALGNESVGGGIRARGAAPSHFIPIGSQEDVELAASGTTGAHVIPFHGPERKPRAVESHNRAARFESAVRQPAVPAPLPAIESDQEPDSSSQASFLHPPSRLLEQPGAAPMVYEAPKSGRSWLWIAAAVAVVFAGIGVWARYFRANPGQGTVTRASFAPVAEVAQPSLNSTATAPLQSQPPSVAPTPAAVRPPVVSAPATVSPAPLLHTSDSILVNGGRSSQTTAPKQQVPNVVSDMFGSLNAHPVSSKASTAKEPLAAPSLDVAPVVADNGALAGIATPSLPAPVAPVQPLPAAPVRVGGQLKPPRLVHSVVPQYPDIARSANIQGTVVIDTVIDKLGRVVNMKVVSGPVLLRQAALDALKQWRYEPSKLDGQPTTVQMTVSIQFKR
jgi:periplasmic protein TonB